MCSLNLTPKILGMQSIDHSPRARRRDLRCATPHHGNPRCSPKREHPEKPLRSHPKDAARTSAAVPQEEVFNSCLKAYADTRRPCVQPITQFGNPCTPVRR